MKDIQLISSQFPSGVAWLLNFLLEIDILIYRENTVENTWNFDNLKSKHSLKEEQYSLQQWIPILSQKKDFSFRDDITIRWSHSFPSGRELNTATILLVRDGRDAIYSYYKRSNFNEAFSDTLHRTDTLLGTPYPETWAIFNLLWSQMIPRDKLFILSFEHIKQDPLPIIQKLLAFLGIQRTNEEIVKAIDQSSFEKAKKAEEAYHKNYASAQKTIINRGGKVQEWLNTMKEEELAFFSGLPNEILKQFDYAVPNQDKESDSYTDSFIKIEKKADRLENLINEGLRSAQNTDWDGAAKILLSALKEAGGHSGYILKIGTILVCLDWLDKLYRSNLQLLDKGAVKMFDLLLDAADKMHSQPFMVISIASILSSYKQKRQALAVAEIAYGLKNINAHNLTEIARIFAINQKFIRARKIFDKACTENWQKMVIADHKKIIKKFLKRTIIADVLRLQKLYKQRLARLVNPPQLPLNKDGKILIHLGCGDKNDQRFINVDITPLPHIHFAKDVKKMDFFHNNYADLIYTCHTLEHISHQETLKTLKEWRRILKENGVLRISVPDFDNIVRIYNEKNQNVAAIVHALMGGQIFDHNYHKCIFNKKYLTDLLLAAGFKEVRTWDPATAEFYSFDDWAGRLIEGKYLISLNLEAVK